jgi:Sec-independent protein translocase protein TatA
MGPDVLIVLIVILVFALMWRGPKTLPKIGQALGRGVKNARDEAREVRAAIDKRDSQPPA